MPHQCLKCGHIFEEGSNQVLKGCPKCKGNRFFFTKKPLSELERNKITKQVGEDINKKLIGLLGEENKEIFDKSGKWITIKVKDLRKAFEPHLPKKSDEKPTESNKVLKPKKDFEKLTDDEYIEEKIAEIEAKLDNITPPETIGIERPGKYNINIKSLLEEEPIIIQKDGSYTIHLPSIFEMIGKEKKR